MIIRDQLTKYLAELYDYQQFEDYCENGLQVEGKEEIQTIGFGVSFNMPFLKEAIARNVDALMVHHGIFQGGNFRIKHALKQKIKLLMQHDISLYGVHLPMDAHPLIGHNAMLMSALGISDFEPLKVGFMGRNKAGHTLDAMLDIFHPMLHEAGQTFAGDGTHEGIFSMSQKYGFTILTFGPAVPRKVAIVSGEGSGYYQKAIDEGVDTFFSGDIEEYMPSISLENRTNYVNLGHYYSEKPGVLALQKRICKDLDVKGQFIEIANPI